MAKMDQFLIAPLQEGFQNNVEPWLIPDQAFAKLRNAYVWRSRLKKRFGSRFIETDTAISGLESLNARLRINIGTTDGSGNLAGTVPGTAFNVGQMFSIGAEIFTVTTAGAADMITNSPTATTHTYNTGTGAYDIQGSLAATDVYFYPATPVTGFAVWEQLAINREKTYAFDTQFSYERTLGAWERLGTAAWTGADYNLFWSENWRGIEASDRYLYVTNNTSTDNVRYWNGTAWTALVPNYDTAGTPGTITGSRIVIGFKDRLLLLNTYETPSGGGASVNFPNRIRYSQNGTPIVTGAGSDATAWLEYPSAVGKGGYFDLPTTQAIISASILRDRLIVFCERSTWEIVFTNNKVTPFSPQLINDELGAESTFSNILFDKMLLGVGNVGIHACNGANVERIDQKIPQAVFKIHNASEGVDRVLGIRDYFTELAYWTLPEADGEDTPTPTAAQKFPTRVLVYNYKNQTWSINDDTITAMGYMQTLSRGIKWKDAKWPWASATYPWNSGSRQADHRKIVAGNQEGFTFIVDPEIEYNAQSLQITQITYASGIATITAIDHTIKGGDVIRIANVQGNAGLDGFYVVITESGDTFTVQEDSIAGTYTGGGTIQRVSQIDIQTKEYNFYQKQGDNLALNKAAFYVDRTEAGEMKIDYRVSSSSLYLADEGISRGAVTGTSILSTYPLTREPFEASQKRLWRVQFPQGYGEVVQLRIYLDSAGIIERFKDDVDKTEEVEKRLLCDFQLHAMSFYTRMVRRF